MDRNLMPSTQPDKARLIIVTDQGSAHVFKDLFDSISLGNRNFLTSKDVFLFEGGTDVSPDMYGEKLGIHSQRPNKARDIHEAMVFKDAQRVGAACIGICRGSQFLTVMSGGKLIQDVTGHTRSHNIRFKTQFNGSSLMEVTSTHHQMMYPFNLPRENYEIIACADRILSKRYLNGENKEIDPPIVEPEIVWYPKTRSLCIQGHPEYMNQKEPFPMYCRELVKRYIFNVA